MRGFRFLPLAVVTAAVAIVVGVVISRQGLHATLAEPSPPGTYALGGAVVIIPIAAVATLPLVMLLVYLRRRSLLGRRPALGRRRPARALLVVLLGILLGGPVLLGGLYLGEFARTALIAGALVIGFVGYGLTLNRLVRWFDERLPVRHG